MQSLRSLSQTSRLLLSFSIFRKRSDGHFYTMTFRAFIQKIFAGHIGIIAIEKASDLLQSGTFGLNEIKIDDDDFADQDGDVYKVELPAQMFETDGVD